MAVTKDKKVEIVEKLRAALTGAKAVVFSENKGLSVSEITELRRKLREDNVTYMVAKKTLIKRAFADEGLGDIPEDILNGPIAISTSQEDEVLPAKAIFNFAKGKEMVSLAGGMVDGKFYTQKEITALAKIPGKEELYAKLVGSLNSPIQGFYGTLRGVVSGLVTVLDAHAKNQQES